MRPTPERLQDILDSIHSIEKYVSRGFDAYTQDELIQVWIIHHIQIIGEAAANVPSAIRDQYPEIPWPDIVAMRNVLVHQYFGIDLNEVWDTVTTDLPILKGYMERILTSLHEER
jgi:uncharacterized protein with HEPN domain